MRVAIGTPYPLGATYDGAGTNFAVFSEAAHRVELCLFDGAGRETRALLPEVSNHCWHGFVPDCHPGQRYGFRVEGPNEPWAGCRCHPSKLLIDPYARAIDGENQWNEALFPYHFGDPDGRPNVLDSAPFVAKSVVTHPYFDWHDDRAPRTPLNESVIYEVHVKGFTARHPDIPENLRGTYSGLAHPAAIAYLQRLGVTAVELMPVHQFVQDSHLLQRGLRNYWGYNTIGFFAPHQGYAATQQPGQQVQEFKQLVRSLHAAGIEVILDVVYNHTAEGNHMGPVLSMKGLDNGAYYRLVPEDRRFYMDYTGTGNTLNVQHPHVLQLIMDSLRYWVSEMHVDGFRFDLASALARELHAVDRLSSFFDLIHQDPVISRVKLIAEPWDVGEGGYQVGNFPHNWSEWNGKYRDCVRDFWKGDAHMGEFACRFTGSADLYGHARRRPSASINFVTAHDGFTLHDLVSYNEKHNEANGEGNRDGDSHNRSWNCGTEGATSDPQIRALRARQKRNLLATLMLSQGVPMLLSGDESGRSQQGNNNAYCQDSPLSWHDWSDADEGLLAFTRSLIALRRAHPVFRRRRFFQGTDVEGSDAKDIAWLRPDGQEMTAHDWSLGYAKCIGIFLNGRGLRSLDAHGNRLVDDSFLVLINAHYEATQFTLLSTPALRWTRILDTYDGSPAVVQGASVPRDLLPGDETSRLQRLRELHVLDTPAEDSFDDLARLAADLCGASTACLSLVDAERQWFKARVGTSGARETSREASFCARAILQPDVMEVPDAHLDPRFRDSPLVKGEPHIRFYAGAPLVTADGYALGTLCVFDSAPMQLSARQKETLQRLSRQAMAQLDLQRRLREALGADAAVPGGSGRAERDSEHLQSGRCAVAARSMIVLRSIRA